MPARNEYAHGTPNWVDLAASDVDRARAFYGSLFGWQFAEEPTDQGSSYVMALKDGQPAAGMMQIQPGNDMPTMWSTYVAVDDVDATAAKVEPAGGSIMMPPMDVMTAGRMAFVVDPTGAPIGLWQKNEHVGAGVVNEHGAMCWNELHSPDVANAAEFYNKVLGWTAQSFPGMESYTIFNVGENGVAGAMAPPMEGVPSQWSVVLAVDDTEAAVAKVLELGGAVLAEPFDMPGVGRDAVVADPMGAVFQVIKLADAPAE